MWKLSLDDVSAITARSGTGNLPVMINTAIAADWRPPPQLQIIGFID